MKLSVRVGLTRRFLFFFLLTAIVPIILLSFVFLKTVDEKLDDRIAVHLHYGIHVGQELYEQDMRKLELLSNEAAFLSVNEKYQHFLSTGEYIPLDRLLNRYQENKKLDIVILIDTTGHSVASTEETIEDTDQASYNNIIQKAFHGKTVNSTEKFLDSSTGKLHLTFLSASPIFSATHAHKVIAVLLTGQYIGNHSSLLRLPNIMPAMGARIYLKKGQDGELVFSTFQNTTDDDDFPEELNTVSLDKDQTKAFDETLDDVTYKTAASVLKNDLGVPVGYLLVSDSKEDVQDLFHRDLSYICIYLILGLAVVFPTGAWFKRTFIDPTIELSSAANQVAQGDLSVRIKKIPTQPELSETIHNFNKMLDQLQESEQLRSNFISTLTHDLRTPLVAQKRALELFETHKAELSPKLAGFAEGLLKSNDNLLEMVNLLLETYQYEAGRITVDIQSFHLFELVDVCFTALSPIAETKHIQLINEVPQSFRQIWADPHQLKRVLTNLVGNALENIPHEKEVRIRAQELEDVIQIQVLDNGPGIPADRLSHLFERYYVGSKTRQKIGSGLGLYICKMILELHGGTIQVENTLGEGTCFTLTLPQEPPEELVENGS